jgi:hypothetical protein
MVCQNRPVADEEEKAMADLRAPRKLAWLLVPCLAVLLTATAMAHHGWGWASDEQFEISGEIVGVSLGNPHGEVTIRKDDQDWLIEVGQPWRNQRAGLTAELLAEGEEITVRGHRSTREGEYRVKAVRVIIDGEYYDLYPDRVF